MQAGTQGTRESPRLGTSQLKTTFLTGNFLRKKIGGGTNCKRESCNKKSMIRRII
jgi:hypothetical protein